LRVEATVSSETLVFVYQTPRRGILEDCDSSCSWLWER